MNTSVPTKVLSISFLKKLILLGLVTLFLVVLTNQLVSGSLFKQGPKLASADQEVNFPDAPAESTPQREITYRGGDCKGNHSVWVHIYNDGTKEITTEVKTKPKVNSSKGN